MKDNIKYIKMDKIDSKELNMDVQEPWYSFIKNGSKIIEGRLNEGMYSNIKNGDIIKLNKHNDDNEFIFLIIREIKKYKSFREMLEFEKIEDVLPNINTIENGINIYRQFLILIYKLFIF